MRQPSEDELMEYRQQAAEERYERDQQRKWAANAALHPQDPDREWPEETEDEKHATI